LRLKSLAVVALLVFTAGSVYAARRVSREFEVGEHPRLVLEVDPTRLVVEPGEMGRIVLEVELPETESYTVACEQEDGKVTVRLETKGTLGLLARRLRLYEMNIRVEVPEDCDVVLMGKSGRVEIRGVGGEIRCRSGSRAERILRWVFRIGSITDSGQANERSG